jgi:peptidoglycan-associated lipoprotein
MLNYKELFKMLKLKLLLSVMLLVFVSACTSTPVEKNVALKEEKAKPKAPIAQLSDAETVLFDFDKSAIREDQREAVVLQANYLKANKAQKVAVEGHTDYLGTPEYNIALGERRASSTKRLLVRNGVESARISVVSYGKDKPVDPAQSDEAREKNRRTVTVVKK